MNRAPERALELLLEYQSVEETLEKPSVLGGPVVLQLLAHLAQQSGKVEDAKEFNSKLLLWIQQHGVVKVMNMPDNFYGGKVTQFDRQVSRWRNQATNVSAVFDAHTCLAELAGEDAAQALKHCELALSAVEGKSDTEVGERLMRAHQNLAAASQAVGDEERCAKHLAEAKTLQEEAQLKAVKDAKEAELQNVPEEEEAAPCEDDVASAGEQ
eukprot:TRINITY_DN14778_c0_g1_i1.p1 TRINITY_DN14778_c0_g1~~TRINITY_DN14778_c0_g1_i1.p1  ORF type:complete len:212 (+),score=74.72 TRINITY_DN14778_c0_g1_i1:134-769(+)